MDTKKDSATADVPTFKVARVGEKRKRKGGILSFFRKGGSVKPAWRGATGGSGVGGTGAGGFTGATVSSAGVINAAGASFSKVVLTVLISAFVGSGAVFMGASLGAAKKPEKKKSFAQEKAPVKIEGDTSNLPTNKNTIPNSMGYVSGSIDGLTPEERAKRAADAEAARIAEEEAARKAEEEAAKNAPPAGAPAVDPAALAAAAAADGRGGANFGKKFGALSTGGASSSLSGGAGLSGGVNRNFGSGTAAFKGGQGGTLSGNRSAAKPTMSKAARASLGKSNVKGFARSQLVNANALSRRGAGASKAETASYDAASAFDNNNGAGNVISGAGIGTGSKPTGEGDNMDMGGDSGGGGGALGGATNCTDDQYPDPNGSGCKDIPKPKDESANKVLDMLCMMAQVMLAAIAVMSVIALAAEATVFGTAVTEAMAGAMAAMGAIIAVLGIAIIAMGDWAQGTIFTLAGAYIGMAAMSWLFPTLTYGGALIASVAGMILGAAAKFLDAK